MKNKSQRASSSTDIAEVFEEVLGQPLEVVLIKPRACEDVPNFIRSVRKLEANSKGSQLQFR